MWWGQGWSHLGRAGLLLHRQDTGSEPSWAELSQTESSGERSNSGLLLVALMEEPWGGGHRLSCHHPEQNPLGLKGPVTLDWVPRDKGCALVRSVTDPRE